MTRRTSRDSGGEMVAWGGQRPRAYTAPGQMLPEQRIRRPSGDTCTSGVPDLHIQKALGDGDFSTVFLGSWKGQEVAVKVLDPRKRSNQGRDLESDFREEVKALSALDHPNCLTLLTTGPLTIVTDLARGVALSEVLYTQRRKLPTPAIFAQKLAEVMSHLHTRSPGIVHRDLKPENVMVALDTSDLKLIDFGMAQCVGAKRTRVAFDGSPLYGAPEALNGAPSSTASEVWSLACVLVEMFGSGRPFGTQGIRNLNDLRAKAQAGVPPWQTLPPVIPRPDLVQRAFSLTPSHRPAASELAQAMQGH